MAGKVSDGLRTSPGRPVHVRLAGRHVPAGLAHAARHEAPDDDLVVNL